MDMTKGWGIRKQSTNKDKVR